MPDEPSIGDEVGEVMTDLMGDVNYIGISLALLLMYINSGKSPFLWVSAPIPVTT